MKRGLLHYYTGLKDPDIFDAELLVPIIEFYKAKKNKKYVNKSSFSIEDRIFFVLVVLYRDVSFRDLYALVKGSKV